MWLARSATCWSAACSPARCCCFWRPRSTIRSLTRWPKASRRRQGPAGRCANYTAFLGSRDGLGVLALTLGLALAATLLSILLSLPLALLLRRRFFGRRALQFLMMLPITIPALVGALGLVILYDRTGWINVVLLKLHVISASAGDRLHDPRSDPVLCLDVLPLWRAGHHVGPGRDRSGAGGSRAGDGRQPARGVPPRAAAAAARQPVGGRRDDLPAVLRRVQRAADRRRRPSADRA